MSGAGAASTVDLERAVWSALGSVRDPEIPPCSITDLGIVERVLVNGGGVEVDLLPTFAGCPALDVIRQDVEAALLRVAPDRTIVVRFVYSKAWTTDRITHAGRKALSSHGIAPPGGGSGPQAVIPLAALKRVDRTASCPYCGSDRTDLESAFGATLCRSTHFCRACRNPFEAFKPKTSAR